MARSAVVVGGGVIGLSCSWAAPRRGVSVTVVDPSPGRGASWAAAGMLAPVSEAEHEDEHLVGLLVAAARRWETFAEELTDATGHDVAYRRCGTVAVALDASDRAVIDEMLDVVGGLGLEARRLSASECRSLVPALSPSVRGGAEVPGDHQVDNRRLLHALRIACERAGVQMIEAEVTDVVTNADGGARGVALADGRHLAADAVLLAAGSSSGQIGGVPSAARPPVRPVKGHILRLRGDARRPLLERTVRGLVHGRACYAVPRSDGTVVLGATTEERGFDATVRAGAVHELLDDARSLVPGIDELELVECLAGLRPGSPDNAPVIGWTTVPGLAVATGHYRNGILLAPLTADAVAALLSGDPISPALERCSPSRFAPAEPSMATSR